MAVTTTSQAKTVVSLLKLVLLGTILLRRVIDGIPCGDSRSDPRSLYPIPSFGPDSRQSLLASPPITFARPDPRRSPS